MLQDRIDNDEHYRILIDHRNPLRIVLATQAMLEAKGPVEPLWDREAGDARSMAATAGRNGASSPRPWAPQPSTSTCASAWRPSRRRNASAPW